MRLTKEVLDGVHGRLAKEVTPAHACRRPSAAGTPDAARIDGSDGSVPERLLGRDDLVDYAFLERAIAAGAAVARLVMDGNGTTEFATGFLVSPRVLMTNQHVLPDRDTAERGRAEFDVTVDATSRIHPGVAFALDPATFFVNDAALDVALVAVTPTSIDGQHQLAEFGYLKLVAQTGKIQIGEAVTIIQHPHGDPRMIALRENQLTKFLDADRLLYSSDTASGSSGSPAFNDRFQVIALHRAGMPRESAGGYRLRDGRVVASLVGIDENMVDWVANEGVRVSAICRFIDTLTDTGDALAELRDAMVGDGDVISRLSRQLPASGPAGPADGALVVDVPLRIHVSLGTGAGLGAAAAVAAGPRLTVAGSGPSLVAAGGMQAESLVVPRIDVDYSNRRGYDEAFLGVSVPMPTLTRAGRTAAAALNGSAHIPYEHFSVVLHRQRRMAIFTASNVDWAAKRHDGLTRKKLSGLGDRDTEKWATDPRLPGQWQLPDVFYTKDRQSFDKGHLVRRDDVCWGATDDEIIRANGDTFHVTNCSPQRANFNRSVLDDHGWGDLENLVARSKDRYCVFAGPIFSDQDVTFEGLDDLGATAVRIPSAFWKVVVNVGDGGKLETHAFRLSQDLSDVKLAELDVTADWRAEEIGILALEKELRLVRFPAEVRHSAAIV